MFFRMGRSNKAATHAGAKVIGTEQGGQWRGKIGTALSDEYESDLGDKLVDVDFGQGSVTLEVEMVRLYHT